VVGDAVSVTVGAVCGATTCADTGAACAAFVVPLPALRSTALGLAFNCAANAGFAPAVPAAALLAGVEEPGEQAASAQIAAHGRTPRAKSGASPAINPPWRLNEVIKNLPGFRRRVYISAQIISGIGRLANLSPFKYVAELRQRVFLMAAKANTREGDRLDVLPARSREKQKSEPAESAGLELNYVARPERAGVAIED
jgi:hypothetical protein